MNKSAAAIFGFAAICVLPSCGSMQPGESNTGNVVVPTTHRSTTPTSYFTQKLLVAGEGNNSLLAFGLPTTGGNIAPTLDIHGSATELDSPFGAAVGGLGKMYGLNGDGKDLLYQYARLATGNIAPDNAPLTTNFFPVAVFVSGNYLWVGIKGVSGPSQVLQYAAGAHGSDPAVNTISGSNTQLGSVSALALNSAGKIYVANSYYSPSYPDCSGANILVFSSTASGNVAPTSSIQGSNTDLCAPYQITFDNSTYGSGRLLVADKTGHVLVFSAGASGNATPIQNITSVAHPAGVATDSSGYIYVSAPSDNQIRVFAPGATGNATPTFKITGSNTNLQSPIQLSIGPY